MRWLEAVVTQNALDSESAASGTAGIVVQTGRVANRSYRCEAGEPDGATLAGVGRKAPMLSFTGKIERRRLIDCT
jgi:hypothetical protein